MFIYDKYVDSVRTDACLYTTIVLIVFAMMGVYLQQIY